MTVCLDDTCVTVADQACLPPSPQLLPLDVHVEADGDEDLALAGVVVLRAGVGVVEAERERPDFLVDHAVPVDLIRNH